MFTLTKKKFLDHTYCCQIDHLGRITNKSDGMAEYLDGTGNPASLFHTKLIAPEHVSNLQNLLLEAKNNGELPANNGIRWFYPAASSVTGRTISADVIMSFDKTKGEFLLLFLPRLDELPGLLSENKVYRSLLSKIQEAHLFCSMEGEVLFANDKARGVLDIDGEATGIELGDVIDLTPATPDWSLAKELAGKGRARTPAKNKKGQDMVCDFSLVYDSVGAPMGMTVYLENDVARLEAIARATELENHIQTIVSDRKFEQDRMRIFQQIVESNREAMLFCDLEGQILYGNKAAQKLYGYELEELSGHNMGDFYDPEDNPTAQIIAGLRDYGFYTGEFKQLDRGGTAMEIQHSCNLVFNETGQPIGILASNRDVGPQRRAERESARKNEELLEIRNRFVEELEAKVEERTRDLNAEREKSEALLQNILPEGTAEELKTTGTTVPRVFDQATILFTDFKDFTSLTKDMAPQDLIAELNVFFTEFDNIIARYNLEKIKTIGDSYMCAGGLPQANSTNAVDAVRAGLAIQKFMRDENDRRQAAGKPVWRLRLGIHTGPVVAGVVGVQKFAYDIWGDAVNVASRVEATGMIQQVNISHDTWQLVKGLFECEERGSIEVKGRGSIPMYFVKQERSH